MNSDQLTKEYLNALARRHKRKARRQKFLKPAPAKPAIAGGIGVADGNVAMTG